MFFVLLFKRLVCSPRLVCLYLSGVFATLKRRIQIACTASWHQLKEDNGSTQCRLYQKSVCTGEKKLFRTTDWLLGIAVDKMHASSFNTFSISCKIAIDWGLSIMGMLLSFFCCFFFPLPLVSHIQAGSRWYRVTRAVRSRGQILHRVASSAERRADHPGELPQPDHPGHHPSPCKTRALTLTRSSVR